MDYSTRVNINLLLLYLFNPCLKTCEWGVKFEVYTNPSTYNINHVDNQFIFLLYILKYFSRKEGRKEEIYFKFKITPFLFVINFTEIWRVVKFVQMELIFVEINGNLKSSAYFSHHQTIEITEKRLKNTIEVLRSLLNKYLTYVLKSLANNVKK